MRSYREVSTANKLRWVKKHQASRKFLDGLSSCQVAIEIESQESRWIEIAITVNKKGSSKGLIDSLTIERCQEAVKIA